ncbi:MAG: hypothetical protein JNL73_03735 [Anaerolineales bacterium]|nr:hypothetical protein [Anaerolineales bacterium]
MQLSHRVAVQQLVGLVTVLSLLVSPLNDAVQVAAANTRQDETTPTATAPVDATEPVVDAATPAVTDTPTDLPTPTETVVAPATETETPTVEPTVTEVPPTSAPVDVEPKPSDPSTTEPSVAAPAPAVSPDAVDATSILFIQNNGQDEAGARFSVRGTAGTIFFADDAIWISIAQAPELINGRPALSQDQKSAPREIANVRLTFVGANPKATVVGIQPVKAAVSFFSGSDTKSWQAGVPTYAGIRYQGLFPHLDLEITSQHGEWVWKLVAADGATVTPGDLARIRLRLEGQDKVELNAAADEFGFATRHGSPVLPLLDISGLSFTNGQARSEVAALHAHVEQDEIVTPFKAQRGGHLLASKGLFRMLGADQLVRPLAHDGNLARLKYSSFLGGDYSHYAIGVAVGSDGAAYVTGWTLAPALPAVPGYDTSPNGVADIFVAKLSANGQSLSYMTFLGGSEDDFGYHIAVNANGEAAVVATIRSTDAPTPNGFDTDFNTGWTNPYLARLNAAGTALLYGTYLGVGQGHDIAIQPGATGGVVYVTGFTVEDTFPITTTVGTEPLDSSYNVGFDGFVSQLDMAQTGAASLRYSSYLGGESSDCERSGDVIECSIAVDASGNVYVTGPTYSTDFPHTASAFSTTITGGSDAFLVRLALNGNGAGDLVYGTFFGGTGDECWESCAVSAAGPTQVYIAGQTESTDLPANAGQTTSGGGVDGFVARFDTTQSGASSRVYSTYLGRGGTDRLLGVAVRGTSGEVFVGGFTDSSDFPATAGAFDSTFANADCGGYTCRDAFAARLDASGARVMFTYVGDVQDDLGWDVASAVVDGQDLVYLAGFSYSADFPVTSSAWDQTNAGSDSFVTAIKDPDPCAGPDLVLGSGVTCTLAAGSYTYTSITVQSGGRLILQGDPTVGAEGAGVTLTVATSLTVETGGLITADGQGFPAGEGPGGSPVDVGSAGYGGEGGIANIDPRYSDAIIFPQGAPGYGNLQQPISLGSGAQGSGGGAIHIAAGGTVTVNGIVSANGGVDGNGAGSGGSIWIQAGTLAGSGVIQAVGGRGVSTNNLGLNASGAGGRIAVDYLASTFSGTVEAPAGPSLGTDHFDPGGPGTVYYAALNKVVVDGNDVARPWRDRDFDAHPAVIVTGTYDLSAIELIHAGYLEFTAGSTLTITNSTVVTGDGSGVLTTQGALTLPVNFTVQDYVLDIQGSLSGVTNLTLADTVDQSGTELFTVLGLHTASSGHIFGDVTIGPRSYLLPYPLDTGDTDYTNDGPFVLQAANVTVQSGGWIWAYGLGYAGTRGNGTGPGAGGGLVNGTYQVGAGGGHGGLGGIATQGWTAFGTGTTYGDAKSPTTLGSAGGAGNYATEEYRGRHGGGAVHVIVSGTLRVDGDVSVSGENSTTQKAGGCAGPFGGGGAGSGGSLWIQAAALVGTGSISAAGGRTAYACEAFLWGGGGGGGRISLDVTNYNFQGQFSVRGGAGSHSGKPGTLTGLPFPRRSMRSASASDDAGICPICEFMRTYGGPINSLTGVVDFSALDLSFPALGGDIRFQRIYSSDYLAGTSQLAPGWTHNLDTRLIFPGDPGGAPGQVIVKLHSANEFIFYELRDEGLASTPGEYTYQPYPGVLANLEWEGASQTYRLTTKDQGVYVFQHNTASASHGKLISWTDPQGHVQTYTYDPTTGNLTEVTAGTRHLAILYVAGRISSVQDHTGRSVSFGYDGNGDLTSVTDVRGEVWTYAYDGASHRLTTVTDPEGRIVERNEYYGDGRAWRQFNGANQLVVELAYTTNPDGTTTVVVTDAHGNAETLTYDRLGTLVTAQSPSGSVDKTFDGNFHADEVSDENGNPTEYLWSADGQVLTQTVDALGNDTLFEYDDLNNITRTVDARGNETAALYDGTFLTSTTNALSQQTLYTYTTGAEIPEQPAGLLKAMSNAVGETTTYGYNAYGQPLTVTNAAGQTMSYAYDTLGRVTSTTDYNGRVTLTDYNPAGQVVTTTANYLAGQPQNHQNLYNLITVHDYDGAGRLRWTRDTEGRTDWVCYDAAGRVNRTVQNASGDGLTPATDPCDAANYVASSDPAEDRIAETVYDDAGNVSATIDAAGIVSRTYYDESNRPYLSVQNFTGSDLTGAITSTIPAWTAAFPDRNVRSQTVYDAVGNVVKTIDNAGLVSATCYDALNRPVKTVQNPTVADPCAPYTPSGTPDQDLTETTTYDENGNVIASADPVGRVTRTWYDVLNRPITTTVNFTGDLADLSAPAYDPGQPDRNLTTETFYDAAGRAYKTVDGVSGRADWTCYDETGRVTRTVQNAQGDPCGTGWLPSSVADEDVATTYTYDATTGRQIAVTAADGQITRTYFDETGRQVAQTANLTGQGIAVETVPAYNPAYADQNVTTRWGYDVLGRTITTTVAAGSAQAQTTHTCYDTLGRVAKTILNPSVADPCVSYTPSSQTDRDVATTYTYDAAGNQIATTDALGRITRTYYDDLGRAIAAVANLMGQGIAVESVPAFDPAYPDRNVRAFTSYDAAGRVLETNDNAGLVTRHTYDSLGRTITTTVHYVSGGPVDDVTNLASGTFYDKLSNVIRSIDAEGVNTGFGYDRVGRLITVTENLVVPGATTPSENVRTIYAYDGRGNRLTITDGRGKLTTFTYDDLDRQRTEQDALGNTWTTTYTKVGLTTSLLDANGQTTTYAYDGLRRVTGIDYPAGTADVAFTYDALGNRSTMTDGTGVTSWTLDALNRPLTITAPSGAVGYGYDRLGNRTQLRYPDTKAVTYTVDALNRIATVQDWASAFTSYTYNAAGQVVTTTLPNGVRTVYGYDAAQRLQSLAHSTTAQTLGAYTYTVDATGNRTAVTETLASLETTVASPDLFDTIYADGFEAGDLAGWYAPSGTGLSVSSAAAYTGTLGFSVAITSTTARFVQSLLPTAEKHYRARFSFDPNTITMNSGSAHFIFRGSTANPIDVVQVEFRRNGTAYELRAGGRNDSSSYTYTPWTVISDAAHWVELDWKASTAVGANNGAVALWIDQTAAGSVTTLDNDTRVIDSVMLGAVYGLDTGTTGTLYFDAFEDRRAHTTIGTEASLPDRLFTNSFESNSLGYWTPTGTGITVTADANLAPGQALGASIAITNTTGRFLGDLTPNREAHYRARLYVDPNTLTMANGNAFYLMAIYTGTTEIGRVELQKVAAGYQVRVNARNDASVWTNTAWVNLSDAGHYLEIDWQAATAPGANNGSLAFWLDGAPQGTLSNLDNDTRRVDLVRIGAVSGLDAGTTGTLYLDAFESRRTSAIGPVQVAGNALTTTAIAYGYDPLYRLTSATYSDGTLFGYAYDAVGNVLTKTQTITGTPATQTYAYDDANRQTSAAGLAQTYDNNGNLAHDGTTAYTWDGANRMTASGSTAYTYNGLNDRVSAGGATHQLDLNAGLTQVLADGTNTYLYGAGRLGEQQGAAWQYHLADGLGSVRQLADASGAVSAAKSYEPYGEMLSSAGTASSVYGFTGEQQDNYNKLVYLRARYYQVENMRFASRDIWPGDEGRPMSYNKWGYSYGDVINLTDPTGHDTYLGGSYFIRGGGVYGFGELSVPTNLLCGSLGCQLGAGIAYISLWNPTLGVTDFEYRHEEVDLSRLPGPLVDPSKYMKTVTMSSVQVIQNGGCDPRARRVGVTNDQWREVSRANFIANAPSKTSGLPMDVVEKLANGMAVNSREPLIVPGAMNLPNAYAVDPLVNPKNILIDAERAMRIYDRRIMNYDQAVDATMRGGSLVKAVSGAALLVDLAVGSIKQGQDLAYRDMTVVVQENQVSPGYFRATLWSYAAKSSYQGGYAIFSRNGYKELFVGGPSISPR